MTTTRNNIFANFAGKLLVSIIGIISVPVYLRYLSVELYGILGVFASIQAVLGLLDGGVSPALGREMARLSVFPNKASEMRNLARTLEIPNWSLALLAGGLALLASPVAARHWVHSETLSQRTLSHAFLLMSAGLAIQWPQNFYISGLMGLRQQQITSLMAIGYSLLRATGSVFVLAYISSSIEAFLVWQIIVSSAYTGISVMAFRRCLPFSPVKPEFRSDLLRGVGHYAAGITGIGIVALILTQVDKIILSRLLTLEQFGYYMLANTIVTTGVGMIVGAVNTAYFPEFSRLFALGDAQALREKYHRACQVMSVILIPAVAVMAAFPYEVLILWTRNDKLASSISFVLSLLAIGSGLNGLMNLPYSMQLAHGLTRLAFYINIVAIFIIIPFLIYTTLHFGASGGALAWVILNASYVLIGIQLMHRMIMKGEMFRWYVDDTGRALLVTVVVVVGCKIIMPETASWLLVFAELIIVLLLGVVASVLFLSHTRHFLTGLVVSRLMKQAGIA